MLQSTNSETTPMINTPLERARMDRGAAGYRRSDQLSVNVAVRPLVTRGRACKMCRWDPSAAQGAGPHLRELPTPTPETDAHDLYKTAEPVPAQPAASLPTPAGVPDRTASNQVLLVRQIATEVSLTYAISPGNLPPSPRRLQSLRP